MESDTPPGRGVSPSCDNCDQRRTHRSHLATFTSPSDQRTRRSFPDFESDAKRRARLRSLWPKLHHLTCGELHAIADLRRLSFAECGPVCQSGLPGPIHRRGLGASPLRRDVLLKLAALMASPSPLARVRRSKPRTSPVVRVPFSGSDGWQRATRCYSSKELSVCSKLPLRSSLRTATTGVRWRPPVQVLDFSVIPLCSKLTGRRVRIVPDADESGFDAAAVWQAELQSADAAVDAVALPPSAKDLGDVVAQPHRHHAFLTSLFQ